MSRLIAFLLLLSCTAILIAQPAEYSRAKIFTGPEGLEELARLGIAVDHGTVKTGHWISCDFSKEEIELARNAGFNVEIEIEDVVTYYASQRASARISSLPSSCAYDEFRSAVVPAGFQLGSYSGYFTYQEMLDNLDSMVARYPDLISVRAPIGSGLTHDGHPIYYVVISDNPALDEGEPKVLYSGVHHAREPGSMSTLIYFMWFVLENYSTIPQVTYVLDEAALYFVPCVNPDGYLYNESTNPSGGGLWRKNRRDNFDGSYGVDLNRNYAYEWGFDNLGSSGFTSSNVYRGPGPASEPEVAMMQDFVIANNFQTALNYHTYGDLLIYPWGYIDDFLSPDSTLFTALANRMTAFNGYSAGTANQTVGYNVNGEANDWFYGEQTSKDKCFALTPEVGESFWATSDNIIPYGEENIRMNALAAMAALQYASVVPLAPPILSEREGIIEVEIERTGTAGNGIYELQLIPASASVLSGSAVMSNPLVAGQREVLHLPYRLTQGIKDGESVAFTIQITYPDKTRFDYVITRDYGQLDAVLHQKNTSDNSLWANQGWSNNRMGSSEIIWSDHAGIGIPDDSRRILHFSDKIDLADAVSAQLQFEARWEIEPGFDYSQLQLSSDGVNWQSMCSRNTVAGNKFQEEGAPVYSGFSDGWKKEIISLDEFAGEEIELRFVSDNDNGNSYSGFQFKNLTIEKVTGQRDVKMLFELSEAKPNPSSDRVIFTAKGPEIREWTVFDASGKVVSMSKGNCSIVELNVSNWTPGLYHIVAVSSSSAVTRHFAVH